MTASVDTYTHAALSLSTLSPDAGSFSTTQDNPLTTDTLVNTVLQSAASDRSVRTSVVSTAPAVTSSESGFSSASTTSGNSDQDVSDLRTATSTSESVPGQNAMNLADQTGSMTPSAAETSAPKATTTTVDTLNKSTGQLSAGGSTSLGAALPVIFGSVACVGVLAMAVTHKKKRDVNVNDSNGPSPDCEYNGASFFPENRMLSVEQEKSSLDATKMPDNCTKKVSASTCSIDFMGTNSLVVSTSPFSTSRKVRTSSPVPSCYGNSETNIEFQDACLRDEGSNVVLTFNEVRADSSQPASQVQL